MSMKITAGLGRADDYLPFADAGADEFFIGYVPEEWTLKYGIHAPLNRREVLYYHVQIGSFSELEILADMMHARKVPVRIACNALYYLPEQYPMIAEIIRSCMELGFYSFIIADPGLLLYLNTLGLAGQLHISVSGEFSEMNSYLTGRLIRSGVSRCIFHRKMSVTEMAGCVSSVGKNDMEWEAFALNENCHFHGAFCNSLHCDELSHICRLPYVFSSESGAPESPSSCSVETVTGSTGCAFCALAKLRKAGITHLKIVGRGNYSACMEQDIRALKKAIMILEASASEEEYLLNMRSELFPRGCSGNCYYR